jgi:hypothetical protein
MCPDAKIRDGDKAITDATKLCELSNWKSDSPLETLAIALAQAGKFAAYKNAKPKAAASEKAAAMSSNWARESRTPPSRGWSSQQM